MALITIPKLTAKAQKVFNAWIRKRDSQDGYFTCISCGRTMTTDLMDCGHFAPVKGGSALRFDEFHLIGYRRGIIDKYGEGMLLHLEQNARLVKKWSRFELNQIIEKYSK